VESELLLEISLVGLETSMISPDSPEFKAILDFYI